MSGNPCRDLDELLKNSGFKVVFGLRAQGHLPTIKAMLAEGASWEAIGDAIGWHADTARKHYQTEEIVDIYLAAERDRLREKVEAMLEEAETLLERDRRMGLSTERMGAKRAAFTAVLALLDGE